MILRERLDGGAVTTWGRAAWSLQVLCIAPQRVAEEMASIPRPTPVLLGEVKSCGPLT